MSLTKLEIKLAKELMRISSRGIERYCESNPLTTCQIITSEKFGEMMLKENDCRASMKWAQEILKEE